MKETPLKDAIIDKIEANRGDIVALLQQLIRFASVNPPGDEKGCGEFVALKLESMGLKPRLIEAEIGRPNVLAELQGEGGGRSLFFYGGHLDVVSPGERSAWIVDPFGGDEINGWIYGRGAADHKGSIAASLMAIKAILELGVVLKGDLIYAVVADEETGGHKGAGYLVENGYLRGDMGIYGGPGDLSEIIIASKGIVQMRVKVKGASAHSGTPWLGKNAIEKASKLILALSGMKFEKRSRVFEELSGPGPLASGLLTVIKIEGGQKANIVPAECEITIDRRLIPEETSAEAIEQIRSLIDRLKSEDPDFDAEIAGFDDLAEAVSIDASEPAVDIVRNAAKYIGINAKPAALFAKSDTTWIVNKGLIPTVGYGAGLRGPDGNVCLHAPNECISIDDLVNMAKVYALAIIDCCGYSAPNLTPDKL